MPINIKQELETNETVMIVIPSQRYSDVLIDIIKQLNNGKVKGLYITLNNPYNSLIKKFKEAEVSCSRCFFIDAVSAGSKLELSAENCIFVSKPNALTELSIAIDETIKTFKPDVMIFDSLSTLMIYVTTKTIDAFAQRLATRIKENNIKAVFPVIKNEELIKNMGMFISKVVEVE